MKKRAFIIAGFILLIAAIVGVILVVRSGSSPEEGKTAEEDVVTVNQAPNGWKLIKHPVFGIAFEVPPAWEITVFENGKGKVEGYLSIEGVNAVVGVHKQSNLSGFPPERFIEELKKEESINGAGDVFQVSEINQGSIKGVNYTTRVVAEDGGFITNSYLLVNRYFTDDELMEISCSLSGPNYRTLILTCEEVLKSLHFTQ